MKYLKSISTLLRKSQGSATIAYHMLGQAQIPYWPQARLNALRDQRVRSIVQYASATVPFYRDLFKRLGLDAQDIRTAADLNRLPVIDKQEVQAEPKRFVSDTQAGQTAFRMTTSGTTGRPLDVYMSRDYILSNVASRERFLAPIREQLDPGTPLRQVSIIYPNNSSQKFNNQVLEHAFLRSRKGVRFLSLLDPLEKIIDEINDLRPNMLTAYGTFIEVLFKTIKAKGIKMHLPKVVLYISDHLSDETIEMLQNDFGISVYSTYASMEALKIGFTCSHRTGFHLMADLAHVRVVDGHGQDAPSGVSGDIIVSNLMNHGTVLLNYRIGDRGQLTDEVCACGRTMPLLAKLEGRLDDVIKLPNGHYIHSATIWLALRDNHDFIQYQLIQHTHNTFELKLVTVDLPTFDRTSADLLTRLQPMLGPDAQITATYLSPSAPFGERKRSQLVSLVK